MGNFWQDLRETAHRVDPIGANLVDNMIRTDSRVAAEVSRGADRLLGRPTPMGRFTRDEARRNIKDPSRAVGRAAATLALMYGAYAYGGAAAGAGAGGGSAGAAMGAELGASYGVGAGSVGGAVGAGYGASLGGSAVEAGVGAGAGSAISETLGGSAPETATTTSPASPAPGTSPASPASPYRRAAESVGTGIATNYVTSLLAPKPETPQVEPVTPMPDPEAQAAARKRKAAMRARQGRVSSILTSPGGY